MYLFHRLLCNHQKNFVSILKVIYSINVIWVTEAWLYEDSLQWFALTCFFKWGLINTAGEEVWVLFWIKSCCFFLALFWKLQEMLFCGKVIESSWGFWKQKYFPTRLKRLSVFPKFNWVIIDQWTGFWGGRIKCKALRLIFSLGGKVCHNLGGSSK